jgi:hypothetical protein
VKGRRELQVDAGEIEEFLPEAAVNAVSRTLTIELGTPCSLTMWSKKTRAIVVAVYRCPSGRKWADLENLSTTVSMTDR